MTPDQFKQARQSLGLSAVEAARVLRFGASSDQAARNAISRIETGVRDLDAARAELLRAYLTGYRPDDWPEKTA